MLFSDATAEYMADKGKRLRATTLEGYRSAIRCHLMPMWGEREIETISFEEVQDWVNSFDLPGAAEKAYKTFRQIYRWVLRRHQLRIWDVTQGVELPKKPTVRRPTLTAEQERVTLKAIVGQPFEVAVLLGAALGLRRCEACAVRIEDVDWRSGWVHVQRGLHVLLQRICDLYLTLLAMMTLMTVIHAPLISDGALSGLKAVYSPVSVKSFSEILLSPWLMFIDRRWDTECYRPVFCRMNATSVLST